MKRSVQSYRLAWSLLWPLLLVLWLTPRSSTPLKLLELCTLLGLWGGALALFWRRRWLRVLTFALPLGCGGVLLAPASRTDPEALRAAYAESLRAYLGTEYLWGGEGRLGIDCSGLVRRGLILANLRLGLSGPDAGLLREALFLWWNDVTARGLREGYQGRTSFVERGPGINQLDPASLLPGDLAVTADGVHVLAYLGGGRWIEADPLAWQVIEVRTPAPANPWFNVPVDRVRWRQLEARLP